MKENLFEGVINNTYLYYDNSKYPLVVSYGLDNNIIEVTVQKLFKNKVLKELVKSSKTLGIMTREQIEDYILDVVEIFLKN